MFIKLSTYLIPMLIEIFLPCYFGEQIIKMSEKLSTAFFHSDWILESPRYKTLAKIFMEFVKKPVQLSVMGVFIINLENFTRICNSAYSLYAVFKRVS